MRLGLGLRLGFGSGSSTSTASKAVCADKAALENSVDDLSNVDVTGGRSSVSSAVNKVKNNLDDLGDSVRADLQPEVDDVKDALNDLETAVGNFGDGSLTDNLQDAGSAIGEGRVDGRDPVQLAEHRMPVNERGGPSGRSSPRRGARAIRLTTNATTVTR